FRSDRYRTNASSERRSAYDHRRRAGKIPRHVRGVFVQFLGSDFDAGNLRHYRLQIGRPWRALDRELCDFETWGVTSASTGRGEFDVTTLGKRFSGCESRTRERARPIVENPIQRRWEYDVHARDHNGGGVFGFADRVR